MLRRLGFAIFLASAALPLGTGAAAAARYTQIQQYEGTLGDSRIGMSLNLRPDGQQINGGHYFYQKYLKDIPLTGEVESSEVVLHEPGGGTFHLHFVGNGSNGSKPLNLENSIGMAGTWASDSGASTLPVSLRGTLGISQELAAHRYENITSESAAVFEARVQAAYRAIMSGDRATAARYVSYPLTVNLPAGVHRSLGDQAEFLQDWDKIFTPPMMASLSRDLPHDMFVHNGMAMLGNGEAWFDAKGLKVVNVPSIPPRE